MKQKQRWKRKPPLWLIIKHDNYRIQGLQGKHTQISLELL